MKRVPSSRVLVVVAVLGAGLLVTSCGDLGAPEPATEQGDSFVSTWRVFLYGAIAVTQEAGGLRLGVGPEMAGRLEHWQHDTFRVVWDMAWLDPLWLRFDVNARGEVARALLGDLGQPDATLQSFAREAAGADAPSAP